MPVKIIRKIIQIFFIIILLLPIWYVDLFWYGTYISADLLGVALTDPLTAVEITLAGRSLWMPLMVSALPLQLCLSAEFSLRADSGEEKEATAGKEISFSSFGNHAAIVARYGIAGF